VILVDANLLLYAYNADSEQHTAAREWLENSLAEPELFCLSWQTITAFRSISTNPRAFPRPLSISKSAKIVSYWLDSPSVAILSPGQRHWPILHDLMVQGQASGPLILDAHLAALAIERGATLHTSDRDFSRFPRLKYLNPLEPNGKRAK
jgi:toxin-antitoxin system PIN domain toxin